MLYEIMLKMAKNKEFNDLELKKDIELFERVGKINNEQKKEINKELKLTKEALFKEGNNE